MGEKTAVKLIGEFGSAENLLDHSAQLKGALRKKVEGHVDDIRMSKFLATIKTDVPVTLHLDELLLTDPDEKQLKGNLCRIGVQKPHRQISGTNPKKC